EDAHYSFAKAANILGFGTESCVKVPVDDAGRMRAATLENAIRSAKDSGRMPFFVGATAGTTVRGAFDPLPELAEVAARNKLWFHVDGAWGGSVILSQKHRHLLEGVELADSAAWDAHKMMGAPLIASVILFNRSGVLRPINDTSGTDYLFHAEDESFDLGQLSLQCGRRVDALKLWLMWRHLGDRGFEEKIDHLFSLAAYAVQKISSIPELRLVEPPPSLNICFRFEPKSGAGTPESVDALNIQIREKLYRKGTSLVNYARVKGRVVIRLIVVNFDLKETDLDRFFEEVVGMGNELSLGRPS
ncbi:MAG: glutamate decarboxylase, partial [Spirochaetia bacterium]|nr:glutamate decarboxylase [Spirochaetia bacterium]